MRDQLTVGQEAHRLSRSLEALSQQLAKRSASQPSTQRAMRSAPACYDAPDLFKLEKYSPDQPRDNRGRFAPGGSGGLRVRSGGSNPLLHPSNSPTWWPSMARDLTLVGLAASGLGVTSVAAMGTRAFSRMILRGMGPVAARMAQQAGGSVVSQFHRLARYMGFKIPRGAMRGVPRTATAGAYNNLPAKAKAVVNNAVKTINRAKGRAATAAAATTAAASRAARTAKPKGPKR